MADSNPLVVETTTSTFENDVLGRSNDVPVVVDFWAPSCGPCRQLTPLLERLAEEFQGKFVLAKVNTEANLDLAAAFGIQAVPLVVAFRDGQPVNQFMGVLPEASVREWLDTIVPSPTDELLKEGEALEPNDFAAAETCYRNALELTPDNVVAKTALARVLLAQNRDEESRAIIDDLAARGFLEPDAERIKSQLDLRAAAADAGDLSELRHAASIEPDDLSLQLKLADALAVAGYHEEALDTCLRIIQQDRDGVGVDAKQSMLKIFDLLDSQSELVGSYRRKLATALY